MIKRNIKIYETVSQISIVETKKEWVLVVQMNAGKTSFIIDRNTSHE